MGHHWLKSTFVVGALLLILSGCDKPPPSNAELATKVSDLESQVGELNQKVEDLETKVSDLEEAKNSQESRIDELEASR